MSFTRPLLVSFGALTLATGLAYPALVTGLARIAFPAKAGGSLVLQGGRVRGSGLIAQATEDPRYFWSRPSPTLPFPTNAGAGAGSTLAQSSPALREAVAARLRALRDSDPGHPDPVPQDLVTASASGLDPHISPEAAQWQVPRIARLRGLDPAHLQALVARHTWKGFPGPPRVEVLSLNLALDREK